MENDILEIANSVFSDNNEDLDKPIRLYREFDSMNHVQLLLEIEMKFNLIFNDSEITKNMTVRDIAVLIRQKGI